MRQPENHIRLSGADCRLIVVQDQLQPCPYLEGVTARMPLRLPVGSVTPQITDRLLAMGYRRSGDFVYRAQCPACNECKPTRIDVDRFRSTRSLKRVLNRGKRELQSRWGPVAVDAARIHLFNQHRNERGLSQGNGPIDAESYRSFLADTCCDSRELSIWRGEQLVAVSIVDVGQTSSSAVYTHFDPQFSRFSLGTLAILLQIEWAQATGRKFVYLGMYVAANPHLNYKARFLPQQRLDGNEWIEIEEAGETSAGRPV